ncbi:hypothetical protein BY458DRAFT_558912 [Sporodiniella umbellata]|nr:hypothetical protein BY458DRAFT_558912 [Sporodiniella umbellata]
METTLIYKDAIFSEVYIRTFPIHKPFVPLFEVFQIVPLFGFEACNANRKVTGRLRMVVDLGLAQRKILELCNQIINHLGYCNLRLLINQFLNMLFNMLIYKEDEKLCMFHQIKE